MSVKDAVIRVRTPDTGWETIGVDRLRGISHENLDQEWDRGGSLQATFDLKREPRTPWPDVAAFSDIEMEVGGVQNWKGRVRKTPSREISDRSISIVCDGLQVHMDEDPYQPVYVHQRTADWRDIRTHFASSLSTFSARPRVSNDRGIVSIGWAKDDVVTNGTAVGITLDLGPNPSGKAKRIVVDYDLVGLAPASNFQLRINGHDSPGLPTISTGAAGADDFSVSFYAGGGFSTFGVLSGSIATARRCVTIYLIASAGFTAATDFTFRAKAIRVFSDTAYESGNQSVLPASAVILDAFARGTQVFSPDRSLIEPTSFGIPELASLLAHKTPREVMDAANAFHDYVLKIDERGRPVFRPQPAAALLEVGEWTAIEGGDASQNSGEEIFNGAVLEAETPQGEPLHVEAFQTAVLEKSAVQLANPTADTNTASWALSGNVGAAVLSRDTGTFDTTPASFRVVSAGFKCVLTGDAAAGTFKAGTTYVLEFRFRPDGGGTYTQSIDGWADGGAAQFQFGTLSDFGKTTVTTLTAATWVTIRVTWSPRVTVASGVAFRYLQGAYGTNSLRLDSFTVYRSVTTLVDRAGFRRRKILPVAAVLPADGLAGRQILDAYLANHRNAAFSGDYQITGPVRETLTGKSVPPEQLGMRTTELLTFMDRTDPNTGAVGRDGRMVRVKYSLETDTATVSIDSQNKNFEALLARFAALAGGGRS